MFPGDEHSFKAYAFVVEIARSSTTMNGGYKHKNIYLSLVQTRI